MPEPAKDKDKGKEGEGAGAAGEGAQLQVPEGHVVIPQSTLDKMGERLDYLEKRGPSFTDQPVAPAAPAGPTTQEILDGIEGQIEGVDKEIDDAVQAGTPFTPLTRKRDKLVEQKSDVRFRSQQDAFQSQGLQLIGQLTDEVVSKKMPHLALVKDDYEKILATMPATGLASPKSKMAAYNLAVGQNMDKIMDLDREKVLRKATDDVKANAAGAGGAGREGGAEGKDGKGEAPSFEEHFGTAAMDALKAQGTTPDEYARKQGHTDAAAYVKFSIEQEEE